MNKSSNKNGWENHPIIIFNNLYIRKNKTYLAYIWKVISNCEKQRVLLLIPNK